jgi:hypothetical protein
MDSISHTGTHALDNGGLDLMCTATASSRRRIGLPKPGRIARSIAWRGCRPCSADRDVKTSWIFQATEPQEQVYACQFRLEAGMKGGVPRCVAVDIAECASERSFNNR